MRCGLQNSDGSGYSQWQGVMQTLGAHQATLNVSSYLQVTLPGPPAAARGAGCSRDGVGICWAACARPKPGALQSVAGPAKPPAGPRCVQLWGAQPDASHAQVWNEPDLTDYFSGNSANSATFFAGNSEDYTDMYLAANNGLRVRAACRAQPRELCHIPASCISWLCWLHTH